MASLQTIVKNLARARREFLYASDAVPAEQWKTSPGDGRWSAGELSAHLIMIEKAVINGAGKVLQNAPKPLLFYRRFHVPMALVEARVIRRKTPIPPDGRLVRQKEEMLAELREVRQGTLAFIEETSGRDLSNYRASHPFLGNLNTYEWFQFIASHEIRHTKQMREIAAGLPKSVSSLQK